MFKFLGSIIMAAIIIFVVSYGVSYNNYINKTPQEKQECALAVMGEVFAEGFGVTGGDIQKQTFDKCTMYEVVRYRVDIEQNR